MSYSAFIFLALRMGARKDVDMPSPLITGMTCSPPTRFVNCIVLSNCLLPTHQNEIQETVKRHSGIYHKKSFPFRSYGMRLYHRHSLSSAGLQISDLSSL